LIAVERQHESPPAQTPASSLGAKPAVTDDSGQGDCPVLPGQASQAETVRLAWSLTLNSNPHPVDLHVGGRLRQRRRLRQMSQAALGAQMGLTFQQLQKYERGSNRISASKLHEAATALATPVAWFFEGLPQETLVLADPRQALADQFLASSEGLELARLVPALTEPRRKRLLALIRVLAKDSDPQALAKAS
jgi:transcriptional regulator with XRE-family HTH domain